MFKHIGRKYKALAIITFILVFLAFIVSGISMIIEGLAGQPVQIYYSVIISPAVFIITGVLIIVLGFFIAWVLSWIWYGIGQMIENTDKMVDMQNEIINRMGGLLDQQQQLLHIERDTAIAAKEVAAVVCAARPCDDVTPQAIIDSSELSEDVPVEAGPDLQ